MLNEQIFILGQKTNALGFRLQVNKDWKSRWYSKDDYADLLLQDLKIRRFIEEKLRAAGVVSVLIERTAGDVVITLQVAKPGLIIGKGGERIEALKNEIRKYVGEVKLKLNVEQIKRSQLSARLLAEEICQQIEGRVPYKRAVNKVVAKAMESKMVKGIKVALSGRLGGVRIARTQKWSEGSVPLQTISANIDYAHLVARTKYGLLGVKIWLNLVPEESYA
ncbi:30S ribosomal protein S3 [candidate division CPR3 bacterium 4484_211]|uniref:Small ribosomal subunit protein uS3 n=1 Tax=candidate division CPR3 bacterium 4484_211 TaxID=1968527 RepID=A0A1W9NZC2_UNCC3|nr:MAG: 30S ribosomal protein S3 [candidate division CPR3 bacterium 4484_211]